jgi:hypothetical protein
MWKTSGPEVVSLKEEPMRSIRKHLTAMRAARPSNRLSYQPNCVRAYSFAANQGSAFLGKQLQPGLARPE